MTVFPQTLINVTVKSKPPLDTNADIKRVITEIEKKLGDQGRVLIRYSGTQPMCRVMVEGPTLEQTEADAQRIADVIKGVLG